MAIARVIKRMTESLQNTVTFFKNKKVLAVSLAVVLLVIFLVALFLPSSPPPNPKAALPTKPAPIPSRVILTGESRVMPTGPHFQEEVNSAWGAVDFSENDLNGLNSQKEVLPDGTTKYAFSSDRPGRQDMILVKDGVIIFTRQVVLDSKTDSYIAANGKPQYTYHEAGFYGPDSATYAYPTRGISFTANTKTNDVFEQFIFKPLSIEEFNQKYKQYLL